MNLLFDQNISYRLIPLISENYPKAQQVRALGLENATDLEIFKFAKNNDYSIVTFDSDFIDLSILKGFPPKIIWIRTGNTTTKNLTKFLNDRFEIIQSFIEENDAHGCLELYES
jgi:predicted nuclease of predicted toxin-antitoxin system